MDEHYRMHQVRSEDWSLRHHRLAQVVTLISVVLTCASFAHAQSVELGVDRNEATLEDHIRLYVRVDGSRSAEPTIKGIEGIFAIRTSGQSSQVSIVNGSINTSVTYTYLLEPLRAGNFTLGPASVTIDDKVYRSESVGLRIVGNGSQGATTPSGRAQGGGGATGSGSNADSASIPPGQQDRDLFVTAELDDTADTKSGKTAYVGEQLRYTFRLYRRIRVANLNAEWPAFDGFLVHDLGEQREYEAVRNGQRYVITEVQKALFPQESGTLHIPPMKLTAAVPVTRGGGHRGIFDNFFQQQETTDKVLETAALTVNVAPLPKPPANFSGLVGNFQIEASLSKTEVPLGDSVTLTMAITGTGNVPQASEPTDPQLGAFLSGFKVYDDKPTSNTSGASGSITGHKTFTKALVPLQEGTFGVPNGVALTYFDPATQRYTTVTSAPLTLHVTPGTAPAIADDTATLNGADATGIPGSAGTLGSGNTASSGPAHKTAVKILGEDILPLYQRDDVIQRPLQGRGLLTWLLFGLGIPPLLYLGMVLWQRRHHARNRDHIQIRQRHAAKKALKALKPITHARHDADHIGATAAEIAKVVRTFLGERLAREGGAITPSEVRTWFTQLGVAPPVTEQFATLLERLDAAQYGAALYRGDTPWSDVLARIPTLIKTLDGVLPYQTNTAAPSSPAHVPSSSALFAILLPLCLGITTAHAASSPVITQAISATPTPSAASDDPQHSVTQARAAYEAGQFAQAATLYEQLIAQGFGNSHLWYNLGNSYLKANDVGRAIAAYRHSLAMQPRNADAQANLLYARSKTQDALEPIPTPSIWRQLFFWHDALSMQAMVILLMIGNGLFWLMLIVQRGGHTASRLWLPKTVCLCVMLALGGSLLWHTIFPTHLAVITSPQATVRSGTQTNSLVLFELHAGSEVQWFEQDNGWVRIGLPDGKQGWVSHTDVITTSL